MEETTIFRKIQKKKVEIPYFKGEARVFRKKYAVEACGEKIGFGPLNMHIKFIITRKGNSLFRGSILMISSDADIKPEYIDNIFHLRCEHVQEDLLNNQSIEVEIPTLKKLLKECWYFYADFLRQTSKDKRNYLA